MDELPSTTMPLTQERNWIMTTLTYRGGGKTLTSGEGRFDLGHYAHKLVLAWTRWRTAREIEAMPFDVRKDIGWPSTDDSKHRTM